MVRPLLFKQLVAELSAIVLLYIFLQVGLVIAEKSILYRCSYYVLQMFKDERLRLFKASIKVNCSNKRFKGIGKNGNPVPSPCIFLTLAQ